MIVDLMRNNLSRIAETGSVRVPALFAVEGYPAVWKKTSTITAKLGTDLAPLDAISRLFPSGSITDAPKIRAMEAITALEAGPRRAYMGLIGFAGPGRAVFNVAILTLELADGEGEARVGLGSDIVADSYADQEWAEPLGKGCFLTRDRKPVRLVETMRFVPGEGVPLLERHIARMMASARALGFAFACPAVKRAMDAATAHARKPCRVRLLLDERGQFTTETAALTIVPDGPV